jgi:hypothetical protein
MVGKEQVVLLAKGIEFTAEGILPGDVVATIFITLDVFAGTRQFAIFFLTPVNLPLVLLMKANCSSDSA